jgi:hypothetical protein
LFVEAAAAALGEAGSRLARTQSEVRILPGEGRGGEAVLEERRRLMCMQAFIFRYYNSKRILIVKYSSFIYT